MDLILGIPERGMLVHMREKGAVKRTSLRKGTSLLLITILLLAVQFLPLFLIPQSGIATASPSARAITGPPTAMPPSADSKGERWGDWVIKTTSSQWLNITFENIKIHGNITIKSGSNVRLEKASKITQMYTKKVHYFFEVQENAQLIMLNSSEIRTERFIAKPTSDINFDNSRLYTGGYLNSSSGVLNLKDSYIENRGVSGDTGVAGTDAMLVLYAETTSFTGSTIMSIGGDGGNGAAGIQGGKGGDSTASIYASAGIISQATLNISGGNAGRGFDAIAGTGTAGGMGGSATVNINTPPNSPHVISSSMISVHGGKGGIGGVGANGQSMPGGDGGRGEVGGNADLRFQGKTITVQNSTIDVRGGDAGKGGKGGESSQKIGGNGGEGGNGGNSFIQMDSQGDYTISDSTILSTGGIGGDGGFFGAGQTTSGNAGNGGKGGNSFLITNVGGKYDGRNSSLETIGGNGARGGLGPLIAGDGGDGGDGTFTVNASRTYFNLGLGKSLSRIGACGGDGGPGGEGVGGTGQLGSGQNGRGGAGGASFTTINSPWSIDVRYTHIRGCKSAGGNQGISKARPGPIGYAQISMQSNYFNSTDGRADWTIEGFNQTDAAVIINTTNAAGQRCFVAPEEKSAKCVVWWYLRVGIPKASQSDQWDITIFVGVLSDNVIYATGSVIGPNAMATFFIKGEDDDYLGMHLFNYTVQAKLKNSNPEQVTIPQKIILTSNKNVYLTPQGVWAPHMKITNPENNQIVNSDNFAPCRAPEPSEETAPGCLKIEGDAWVDDRNAEGAIGDVWVTITKSDDASVTFSWKVDGKKTGVQLGQPKARRTSWFLNWEVGKIDSKTNDWLWPAGDYVVTVKCNDGFYWSDNVGRGGAIITVNVTLKHPPFIELRPTIFAGQDINKTYKYFEDGVKADFNDAKVTINSKTMKIIRYEWAFENENHADWAYVPQDCGYGQTCTIPSTSHVYNTTGIKTAYFCVVDSHGRRYCESKRIQIDRTAPPPASPIEDFVTFFFIPLALLAILIMIVAILANVMARKRIERRFEELSTTHKIEVHANACDRCGDPLQEGTTACKRCDATDYLSSIQQVILEIKGSGVNVIDAEAMLEDAVSLYDQGQYEPAKQKAYEAQVKANELRGKYVETTEVISQWEARINKIKDDAGGVKLDQCEAETTVYHARLALGRGDFQMVHDYLSKIEPQIEAMKGLVKVKVVETRIGVVEKMIANVQSRGIKVLEAEDILRKSKVTFTGGDHDAALVQAERAEKAIKRTNMLFIESSERITQVEERMDKADKKGEADIVAQGRAALEKMKTAFLDGLYDNVMEIWKEVDKVLPPLRVAKKLSWEKEATRLTVEGSADAKVEAEQAPPAALVADIQKAEAKAAAEAKKPTQAEAAELLQKCYDRIMLARQNAIETTDADELYNDSRKEMEKGNYDVAADYSRNAIFLMEELLQVMGVKIPEEKKPEPVPEVKPPEPTVEVKPEAPKVEEKPAAPAEGACPSCGKTVKARWATCPYCGIVLTAEAAPPEKPVEEVQGYAPKEEKPMMPYGPADKVEEIKTQEYLPQETKVKEYIGGETTEGYKPERLATKEYLPEQPEIKPEVPEAPKVEEKPAAAPEKVKCLICGRDVKAKWKTCPYCGATLGEGTITAPPVQVTAPPPAEVKPKCPSCGKDVKPKWKTCPYCGAATGEAPAPAPTPAPEPAPAPAPVSDKPKCPNCGKDVKPKWRTCPYCGASI